MEKKSRNLLLACKKGKLDSIKSVINDGTYNWSFYFQISCKYGHKEIVSLLLQKNTIDIIRGIYYACKYGQKEIAKLILSENLHGYSADRCLYYACRYGQKEIINFIITNNISENWNEGFKGACDGGYIDIMEIMIKMGANNLIIGLFSVCSHGHKELVNFLIDKGLEHITNKVWNKALQRACSGGNKEIINMILEKGANDLNKGLASACLKGYEEIAKMMIEKGATNLDNAFINACIYNRKHIVKFLLDKGVNNLNEGLTTLCKLCFDKNDKLRLLITNKHKELILLLLVKGANIDYCTVPLSLVDIEYLIKSGIKDFSGYNDTSKSIRNKMNIIYNRIQDKLPNDIAKICMIY